MELRLDGSGIGVRDEGVLITPTPAFTIKTRLSRSSEKVFINICTDKTIDIPSTKKKLDADGNEVEGTNVPVSVGPIRETLDKSGRSAVAVDTVIHPSVLTASNNDVLGGGDRDFLCQFMIQCVEQKNKMKLDRKYTLPRLLYQGWVDNVTGDAVDRSSDNASVASQMVRDVSKRPSIQEVESKPSSTTRTPPTSTTIDCATRTIAPKVAVMSPPRSTSQPIPINVAIETTGGDVLRLSDFIDGVLRHDVARMDVQPAVTPTSSVSVSSSGDALFLVDGSQLKAGRIHLKCTLQCKPETLRTELSAYALRISAQGYSLTERFLPFPVDPSSANITYHISSKLLSIAVCVATEPRMDDSPDVGSHPWMLQRGLNHTNKHRRAKTNTDSCRPATKGAGVKCDEKIGGGTNDIDGTNGDGDFRNSDDDNGDGDGDDDIYPEDRFHNSDAISQHMLALQRQEQSSVGRRPASGTGTAALAELF